MMPRPRREKPAKDTASHYAPPNNVLRIAEQRTGAIRRAWAAETVWKPADYAILAESCYMQGVNDTIDAAIRHGWVPGPNPLPNDPDTSLARMEFWP